MTTPVPSASESGKLRLGFFTSPAVKVTLFQASAEKSEPTCATASTVKVLTKTPPADIVQRSQACIAPEIAVEIRRQGLGIATKENSQQHQSQQRRNLGCREDVLNHRAGLDSENIDHREHHDHNNRGKVLRVQADIHVAENHGTDMDRRKADAGSNY